MASPEVQAPPAEQPPAEPPTEEQILAALTVLLLAGLTVQQMASYATALLAPLGIAAATVEAAVSLLPSLTVIIDIPEPLTAAGHIARTAAPRRAAFLLSSIRRLEAGGSVDAERRYLEAHLNAERTRRESAQAVDQAAKRFGTPTRAGPVLGWYARQDNRTTPECAAAHRRNFLAARPPLIGYPGTLHGGACRCVSGPPIPGAKFVDDPIEDR